MRCDCRRSQEIVTWLPSLVSIVYDGPPERRKELKKRMQVASRMERQLECSEGAVTHTPARPATATAKGGVRVV